MTPTIYLHAGPISPNARDREPGVLLVLNDVLADAPTITTTTAGFGALTAPLALDGYEWERMKRRPLWHLTAWCRGRKVYEGRLERAGGNGTITGIGYYNSLDDRLYDGKFSDQVAASAIVKDIVKRPAASLDPTERYLLDTGIKVKVEDFDGTETCKQILEQVLDVSGYADPVPFLFALWEGRVAHLLPQETALISWTIPRSALEGAPTIMMDAMELYSQAVVRWEKPAESGSSGGSTEQTHRSPEDPLALRRLGGVTRQLSAGGGEFVDSKDEAEQLARAQLRQHQAPIAPFQVALSGPVYDHVGGLRDPWEIRAGCVVRLDLASGDSRYADDAYRLAFVNETSWQGPRVQLNCEPLTGFRPDQATVGRRASSRLLRVA